MGIYMWENPLSEVYQEVKYIESSGSSCGLNTGVIPNNTSYFEIGFKMNPTVLKTSSNYFYGTDGGSGSAWHSFEYANNSYDQRAYFNVGTSTKICQIPSSSITTGTDYEFICKYNGNSGGTLTISGSFDLTASYSGSTGTNPLYFFCQGNSLSSQSAEKLYYLKIYTGTSESAKTLVRDLVPCYRKSDSVIGMYDTVNDVFYTNAGSGTFTKGPDVN